MTKRIFKLLTPIPLAVATFFGLVTVLFLFLRLLNLFPAQEKIQLVLFPVDVLVGLTIYVKTSVDFAILIGNLMHKHPGVKNRIAIELGTALGNGLGTLLILTVWTFFKEIPLLMTLMIVLASLVLFRMSQDSLKEFFETNATIPLLFKRLLLFIYTLLSKINAIVNPVISLLLPHNSSQGKTAISFWQLLFFSFSIPFVLGLDDFAGYIPLFSIVNVFGFAIGVFLGHLLLNISLFASPTITTKIVRQPIIMVLGAGVFISLAILGFYEAFHILF
jgi:hypothetical protein